MTVTVKILRNERQDQLTSSPMPNCTSAESELDGLKSIGFAIWRRRDGKGARVTFPARPFNVNGDKTNFALLRAIDDPKAQNQVRELVIRVYAEHEQHVAEVAS